MSSGMLTLNKRAADRSMEAMGIRNSIRATADIQALGFHQPPSIEYLKSFDQVDVSKAPSARDGIFNDYRESDRTDAD